MRVVFDYPPMIDEIDAAFHIKGLPVLFCWGATIYNPMKTEIHECLVVHETVHRHQQSDFKSIEGWWKKYIDDAEFRLSQEIPAHRAEYYSFVSKYGGDRNTRRRILGHLASRLAAPMYGRMITVAEAKKELVA